MAAAAARTLDISERQVAVSYWDDQDFQWHVRVLLVGGGAGKWVWVTPDHEVQYGDLATHTVIALPRNGEYPDRVRGNVYGFDPFAAGELEALKEEAAGLADALGIPIGGLLAGRQAPRWIVSDPAHEEFGNEVDGQIIAQPAKFVRRGAVALAQLGEEESHWVSCQNVRKELHDKWLDEKHGGPGRDPRVCPLVRVTAGGVRRRQLDLAVAAHRFHDWADWPFPGPRASSELLAGVLSSGLQISAYANHYIQVSGLGPTSNVAHEVRTLFGVLRYLSEVDQLDTGNLAGAELVSRRLLQIQRAVKRNPRHPDFSGLDIMMLSTLDETGAIVARKYEEWLAKEAGQNALILKQQRQLKDEEDASAERQAEAGKKGK